MPTNDDPLTVDPTALAKATAWLRRRGVAGPPSPLVAARLALRAANRQLELVLLLCGAALLIAWTLVAELADLSIDVDGTDISGTLVIAVFYLLLAAATWWTTRHLLTGERRIAAALPRRVAHSDRRGAATVLGGWYPAAFVLTYPGGVAIGLVALFGHDPTNRILGAVFAVGTLAVGGIAAIVAAKSVRRPALADDDTSLAVDDALRTEDAHRVVPFPLAMAVIAAVNTVNGDALMWTLLAYAAVGAALWAVTMLRGGTAPIRVDTPLGADR